MVAIREGRKWQRGILTQIRGDGTAVVALRDWGRIIERPCYDLYILEDKFRQLEWQTIPCALAHTGPDPAKKKWSRRTRQLTQFLMERHEGWISIVGDINCARETGNEKRMRQRSEEC